MTPQSVMAIMAEIEEEDPLDFSSLSIRAEDARALMAAHFCEVDRRLEAAGLGTDERATVMAAIAAHVTEENMLLNAASLRRLADAGDFREWLKRHGMSGGE